MGSLPKRGEVGLTREREPEHNTKISKLGIGDDHCFHFSNILVKWQVKGNGFW